ncbi:CDPK-related kinase 5, partial [Dichanthelium oligosanthes]
LVQILNVVAFCHIQGVVHRDLKPENFLFTSKDENSHLKAIDFGLSDFVKPDERLNDIVGSAYYVAPEVLHRCYSTEADVWSIGVIAYILLCGSRPFWARTESGIFRSVLKADPSYNEAPWPSLTPEAMDFVKRLLCKDPRRRMTAAQALSHPWIRNYNDIKLPLDILIFRLIKAYIRSSSLRKAALRVSTSKFCSDYYRFVLHDIPSSVWQLSLALCYSKSVLLIPERLALSKTLTVDELFYLKAQFSLLEPDRNGCITLDNIRMALTREATNAMKESRVQEILVSLSALQYRRMDFQEFCAAAVSVHQLEALDRWEQHARSAYEHFEKDGNRAIVIDELASELGLSPSVPLHVVLQDWIRHTDGKLSFLGFVKLLHGMSSRLAFGAWTYSRTAIVIVIVLTDESGRSLEGIKLVECKAYLKKNGLSQTGDIATCVDRIVLHWRFKDGDPERIYPRSSFCINCKGDVCRGDAVLFKQKVYEKRLHYLFNSIDSSVLEQRTWEITTFASVACQRAQPIQNDDFSSGLKGKKKLEKEKHKSQSGRPDCQSNINVVDKGKKRPAQSSKFDLPNKRSKKEVSQVPCGKKCTGGRKAKKNRAHLDKSICTCHGSSLCNDNREKNHATIQKKCHIAPLNKGPSSTEVGMSKRIAGSDKWNRIDGRHAQFEGRYITPATHVEANHGNFVVVRHPFVERPQRPPPLREVASVLLPCPVGSHPDALFNTTMGFRHQNAAGTGPHAPAYFRGLAPNQHRVAFPLPNMPQTVYRPYPEAAYVVPRFRYPSGSTGSRP